MANPLYSIISFRDVIPGAPAPVQVMGEAGGATLFVVLGAVGLVVLGITMGRGPGEWGLALPQIPTAPVQCHHPWLAPMAVLTSQLVHPYGGSRLNYTDGGIAWHADRMADAHAALPLSSTGCYSCATVANLCIQRGMGRPDGVVGNPGWPRIGVG